MTTQEKRDIINAILTEMTERSKIPINTDPLQYVAMTNSFDVPEYGCYHSGHVITEQLHFLMPFSDPRALEIIFHEIAHATGTRLGRNMGFLFPHEYSNEECIAELASFKLLEHFGLADEQQKNWCREYINMHLDRNHFTRLEIEEQHFKADEAVAYILKNWLIDFGQQQTQKAA
jgi:hypothetical protein